MLFEARFLADASSNKNQKPKRIALDATHLVRFRSRYIPPELTEQREYETALGYAFRRSLSTEPFDGPEMLHTVLDCARPLAQQLAEEGALLQTRALNGSITLNQASELSIDLGVRSQIAYRMGHLLTLGLADMISHPGVPCASVLTALAWFGDNHGLLPRLLRDYRAIFDRPESGMPPLLSAIGSGSKREFDMIMGLGDINPDMRNVHPRELGETCTPIMMALSIWCLGDLSRGCPAWEVYATRLEMLKTVSSH
jgi:hypothetical protein